MASPPSGDNEEETSTGATESGANPKPNPKLPSFNSANFNIGEFRLTQSFEEHAGGEKLLTTIPVRKPSKESWFRTHPDENYRLPTPVIELKERGETYLVVNHLWQELSGDPTFVPKLLIPTLTKQGDLLLWPIRLPGPDGNIDDYNASAMEAATYAREKWVRMAARRSLGAYEITLGPDPQAEPAWPQKSLEEMVRIAFKGRIIDSLDHPVVRELRGR